MRPDVTCRVYAARIHMKFASSAHSIDESCQLYAAPFLLLRSRAIRPVVYLSCLRSLAMAGHNIRDAYAARLVVGGQTYASTDSQVQSPGAAEMFNRPCVDCGLFTGDFCDYCEAADRMPNEVWAPNQGTPLCSRCDDKHDACHYCRGQLWCTPPPHQQTCGQASQAQG